MKNILFILAFIPALGFSQLTDLSKYHDASRILEIIDDNCSYLDTKIDNVESGEAYDTTYLYDTKLTQMSDSLADAIYPEDTATMLAGYAPVTAIQPADTTAMLSPYAKSSEIGDAVNVDTDSITVEDLDGGDHAVFYNGSDTIPPYFPYSSREVSSLTSNAQTGTSYTPVLSDAGKFITMSNGSANTFDLPTNASVEFPLDTELRVFWLGAGTTTIDPAVGVTLNGATDNIAISAQYKEATIKKLTTNVWITWE